MKTSLSSRLRNTILGVALFNVMLALLAVDLAYEDIKDSILEVELEEERQVLVERLRRDGSIGEAWRTANLTAAFVPEGNGADRIPAVFDDLGPPYSGEVVRDDDLFLVMVESLAEPAGTLYLAQDISTLRDREHRFQIAFVVIAGLMLLLTLLAAHVGAFYLFRPFKRLTQQIRYIVPGRAMHRLTTHYREREYTDIAVTVNSFLDALEDHIRREQSMLALASHELRTPLTVMAGALDVLEAREDLSERDRRTLSRIRRACSEMSDDANVLLALFRGNQAECSARPVDLETVVRDVVEEIEQLRPGSRDRVHVIRPETPSTRHADPSLLRMLFRNLIQNALLHTSGLVWVEFHAGCIEVTDQGEGLPDSVRSQIEATRWESAMDDAMPGLGLFIVRLICDYLHWHVQVLHSDTSGTRLALCFDPAGPRI